MTISDKDMQGFFFVFVFFGVGLVHLGASWGGLGGLLVPFWVFLGHLGRSGGDLGGSGGLLGGSWGSLRELLGRLGVVLGGLGALLWGSWGGLGWSWGDLKATLGAVKFLIVFLIDFGRQHNFFDRFFLDLESILDSPNPERIE